MAGFRGSCQQFYGTCRVGKLIIATAGTLETAHNLTSRIITSTVEEPDGTDKSRTRPDFYRRTLAVGSGYDVRKSERVALVSENRPLIVYRRTSTLALQDKALDAT